MSGAFTALKFLHGDGPGAAVSSTAPAAAPGAAAAPEADAEALKRKLLEALDPEAPSALSMRARHAAPWELRESHPRPDPDLTHSDRRSNQDAARVYPRSTPGSAQSLPQTQSQPQIGQNQPQIDPKSASHRPRTTPIRPQTDRPEL